MQNLSTSEIFWYIIMPPFSIITFLIIWVKYLAGKLNEEKEKAENNLYSPVPLNKLNLDSKYEVLFFIKNRIQTNTKFVVGQGYIRYYGQERVLPFPAQIVFRSEDQSLTLKRDNVYKIKSSEETLYLSRVFS